MTRKKRASNTKRTDSESDTKMVAFETEGQLWFISAKIRRVGELIKQQDPSSLFTNEGAYGIGSILTNLADGLDAIKNK